MATAKKATKTTQGRNLDRALVSTMESYEVDYLAEKHGVTGKAVKAAVAKVGHSRTKVEAELKASKTNGSRSRAMDRALVSTMQVYEVKYLAQKHGVTQKAVKEAVGLVGHSRIKVESALRAGKKTA